TARLAVLYFPISAPAQEVIKGEANLLHRAPLEYPAEALEKGIQGTVVVEAKLNERGVVTDAHVVSGPEPLRKAALKSVLEWHYSTQAQSPVQVAIDFRLPSKAGPTPQVSTIEPGIVRGIRFLGLTQSIGDALKTAHLPVQVGGPVDNYSLSQLRQALHDRDEHLSV